MGSSAKPNRPHLNPVHTPNLKTCDPHVHRSESGPHTSPTGLWIGTPKSDRGGVCGRHWRANGGVVWSRRSGSEVPTESGTDDREILTVVEELPGVDLGRMSAWSCQKFKDWYAGKDSNLRPLLCSTDQASLVRLGAEIVTFSRSANPSIRSVFRVLKESSSTELPAYIIDSVYRSFNYLSTPILVPTPDRESACAMRRAEVPHLSRPIPASSGSPVTRRRSYPEGRS